MSKSADRYNGDSLISLQKRFVSAAFILLLFFLCLAQALTEEDPKARAEVQKVIEYPGDSGMTEELYPLRIMLEQLLYGQEGTWSIYIKIMIRSWRMIWSTPAICHRVRKRS